MNEQPKPVDLYLVENTAIDGVHWPKGHVIEQADPELAITLAGAGKARVATSEELAAAKKAKK